MTTADFKDSINKVVAIIQDEIGGDQDVLQRIEARINWFVNDLDQQIEAASHPLEKKPKPGNSRQLQTPPPTTPPAKLRQVKTRPEAT